MASEGSSLSLDLGFQISLGFSLKHPVQRARSFSRRVYELSIAKLIPSLRPSMPVSRGVSLRTSSFESQYLWHLSDARSALPFIRLLDEQDSCWGILQLLSRLKSSDFLTLSPLPHHALASFPHRRSVHDRRACGHARKGRGIWFQSPEPCICLNLILAACSMDLPSNFSVRLQSPLPVVQLQTLCAEEADTSIYNVSPAMHIEPRLHA